MIHSLKPLQQKSYEDSYDYYKGRWIGDILGVVSGVEGVMRHIKNGGSSYRYLPYGLFEGNQTGGSVGRRYRVSGSN